MHFSRIARILGWQADDLLQTARDVAVAMPWYILSSRFVAWSVREDGLDVFVCVVSWVPSTLWNDRHEARVEQVEPGYHSSGIWMICPCKMSHQSCGFEIYRDTVVVRVGVLQRACVTLSLQISWRGSLTSLHYPE